MTPVAGTTTSDEPPGTDSPPPRYTVGALLGRGGMGAVYSARDTTLGRDVALKELPPEAVNTPGASARLAREAAITSRLDHPGIVSVYDRGFLEDGRPFYTMRLVRGETLARAAANTNTADARRQLVRNVLAAAEAVAAAHDAGVVHRDLKPSNILIGPHGETQVVDWGLATPTAAATPRWLGLPDAPTRGAVGTAPYMAPEQGRGEGADPRHDVWSLGHTLAEVVGGENAEIPAEIGAIIERATAPDIARRYPDASAFADDLLRWFEGRRVVAYDYSAGDLLRRTLRAWRRPLIVAAIGALALAVAVAGGWWSTTRALDRALEAEGDARAALADQRVQTAVVATKSGARESAERLALSVLQEREDPLARGVFAAFGRSERPTLLREAPAPVCVWTALPTGANWVLCSDGSAISRWEDGRVAWTTHVRAMSAEISGESVILSDVEGNTSVLNAKTGQLRGTWPLSGAVWSPETAPRVLWTGEGIFESAVPVSAGCAGRIRVASVNPAGRFAAMCDDGVLLLGDSTNPAATRVATDASGDHVAASIAWTPDGRVIVGTLRGRLYVLSGASGEVLTVGTTQLGALNTVAVSPDGGLAAVGGTLGGIGVWRVETGELVGEIPAASPRSFAFADGGLRVADGRLRTWQLPSGAPAVVHGSGGLADVGASPDGTHIATAAGDGKIRVTDLKTGVGQHLQLGDRVAKAVAFAPDGLRVLASGMAAPFLAWSDAGGWSAVAAARPLRRLAWLPDGSFVGADLIAGLYRWTVPDSPPEILALDRMFGDLERDADAFVTLDTLGNIDRWEGTTIGHLAARVDARAVASRGERLAIALPEAVEVRDAAGVRVLSVAGESLLDVALSTDGGRVAASGMSGDIRVWDVATGNLLGVLSGHTERVVALEFLADGDLVSASWDKTARIWDLGALDEPVADLAAQVAAAWGANPE